MARRRAVAVFCGALGMTAIAAVVAPAFGQEANGDEPSGKFDYTIIDGRVDESTLRGYTVYTGSCMPCHGPDGLGSAFAPSLVRASERRTFEDFAFSIIQGRDILPGQVMPSFANDMRVMTHVRDIWNYLGARSEGGLGRGRPRLIEPDQITDEPQREGESATADEPQGEGEPTTAEPQGEEARPAEDPPQSEDDQQGG